MPIEQVRLIRQIEYDKDGLCLIKTPLLNFLFYTFLESDKIMEDLFKCIPYLNQLIRIEIERLVTVESFRPAY